MGTSDARNFFGSNFQSNVLVRMPRCLISEDLPTLTFQSDQLRAIIVVLIRFRASIFCLFERMIKWGMFDMIVASV